MNRSPLGPSQSNNLDATNSVHQPHTCSLLEIFVSSVRVEKLPWVPWVDVPQERTKAEKVYPNSSDAIISKGKSECLNIYLHTNNARMLQDFNRNLINIWIIVTKHLNTHQF